MNTLCLKYVLNAKLSYSTAAQNALKKLKLEAEKEGTFDDLKAEYENILVKISPDPANDLDKYRIEIAEML